MSCEKAQFFIRAHQHAEKQKCQVVTEVIYTVVQIEGNWKRWQNGLKCIFMKWNFSMHSYLYVLLNALSCGILFFCVVTNCFEICSFMFGLRYCIAFTGHRDMLIFDVKQIACAVKHWKENVRKCTVQLLKCKLHFFHMKIITLSSLYVSQDCVLLSVLTASLLFYNPL